MVDKKKNSIGATEIANLIGTLGGLAATVGFGADPAMGKQITEGITSIGSVIDRPRDTDTLLGVVDSAENFPNQDIITELLLGGELSLGKKGIARGLSQKPVDPNAAIMDQLNLDLKREQLKQLKNTPSFKEKKTFEAGLKSELERDKQNFKAKQALDAKIDKRLNNNKRIDAIKSADEGLTLLNNIEKNLGSSSALGTISGPLTEALSSISPSLGARFAGDDNAVIGFQQLKELVALKVKSFSGATASDKERAFLQATLPSSSQNPELFRQSIANQRQQLLYAKFLQYQEDFNTTNSFSAVKRSVDERQYSAFKKLQRMINNGKQVQGDPTTSQDVWKAQVLFAVMQGNNNELEQLKQIQAQKGYSLKEE